MLLTVEACVRWIRMVLRLLANMRCSTNGEPALDFLERRSSPGCGVRFRSAMPVIESYLPEGCMLPHGRDRAATQLTPTVHFCPASVPKRGDWGGYVISTGLFLYLADWNEQISIFPIRSRDITGQNLHIAHCNILLQTVFGVWVLLEPSKLLRKTLRAALPPIQICNLPRESIRIRSNPL